MICLKVLLQIQRVGFFNDFFIKLYNAIYDTSSHSVNLVFPFGSNPVTITLTSDIFSGVPTSLRDFIHAFWYFAIYLYIIRDIYKQINDISQGDFDSKVDNIKTEVL